MKKQIVVGILGASQATHGMDFYQVLCERMMSARDPFEMRLVNRTGGSLLERVRELVENQTEHRPKVTHVVVTGYEAYLEIPAVHDAMRGSVEMLDPIGLTVAALAKMELTGPVGLFGARSSEAVNLYGRALEARGLKLARLGDVSVDYVHRGIESVQKNRESQAISHFMLAADELLRLRVKRVIVGCREVRAVVKKLKLPFQIVDPAQMVADEVIRLASSHGRSTSIAV